MTSFTIRKTATAIFLAIGTTALAGCTSPGVPLNRGLESVHQPVVQRTNYSFDLSVGPGGLGPSEQRRLAGWFDALDLHYGDRISIDDPVASASTKASVEAVAARFGMLVSEGAPTTPGYVNAGTVRIIVSRTSASVQGCPDWGTKSDTNLNNATASGFGCAVNGNLAAMIANPEDLVKGARSKGQTSVMSSDKAIDSYRSQTPTGEKGLKANSTSNGGG